MAKAKGIEAEGQPECMEAWVSREQERVKISELLGKLLPLVA